VCFVVKLKQNKTPAASLSFALAAYAPSSKKKIKSATASSANFKR